MDLRELLGTPGCLVANPHAHDEIRQIELGEGDAVELWEGGGQALRRRIAGRRVLHPLSADRARLDFHSLRELDPYDRRPGGTPVASFTAQVELETGPFALRCQVVWRVAEDEHPWLVFPHRLTFDLDPLQVGQPRHLDWPPEALEEPTLREIYRSHQRATEANRRYYCPAHATELPQRALVALDLPPAAFAPWEPAPPAPPKGA